MPVRPTVIGDLAAMASRATKRRGVVLAALTVVERGLAPVLAWAFVERGPRDKVAVAIVFGAAFTARALVQRLAATRAEAELFERAAAGVLDGDVLESSVLPDQDARLEVARGVFHAAQLLGEALPSLCGDLVASALLAAVVAALEPPRLVAFAASATVLAAGALVLARRAVAGTEARAWELQERVYDSFADVLEGRLEIVASAARGAFLHGFATRTRAWAAVGVRAAWAGIVSGRLAMAALAGFVGMALLASATLRASVALTLADAAVLASAAPAFLGVAQGLQTLARDGRWARLAARLVTAGARRPVRTAAAEPVPPLPAPVAIDRVTFAYEPPGPGEPAPDGAPGRPALANVSITWSGREILALSGSNGSGKSTFLRVLLALATPAEGTVRVAGVALGAIDPEAWRARIAFLPQRPYLPPRSDVRHAVRWPAGGAGDERILAALERVGLLDALRRRAGEASGDPLAVRVEALSVGQRQRVALARLLCRDAKVFLLDEPDANLDRAGIALVSSLVRELGARGMVAFAAHTPELLQAADRVVALEEGRVA